MSRSGYVDDCEGDTWALVRWRGAVKSAMRGKRGQAALREILAALDSMQVKELAIDSLVNADGQYCTLGVLGSARGLDMSNIDPDDRESVAKAFGISEAMAAEIMYFNDESVSDFEWQDFEVFGPLRPPARRVICIKVPIGDHRQKRWKYMRDWVANRIQ